MDRGPDPFGSGGRLGATNKYPLVNFRYSRGRGRGTRASLSPGENSARGPKGLQFYENEIDEGERTIYARLPQGPIRNAGGRTALRKSWPRKSLGCEILGRENPRGPIPLDQTREAKWKSSAPKKSSNRRKDLPLMRIASQVSEKNVRRRTSLPVTSRREKYVRRRLDMCGNRRRFPVTARREGAGVR